jgi:hypothetical protein
MIDSACTAKMHPHVLKSGFRSLRRRIELLIGLSLAGLLPGCGSAGGDVAHDSSAETPRVDVGDTPDQHQLDAESAEGEGPQNGDEPPVAVLPELDGERPQVATETRSPEALQVDEIRFGGGSAISISVDDNPQDNGTAGDGDDSGNAGDTVNAEPIVRCAAATATGDDPLIDDFEDGDINTLIQDGRDGTWYPYASTDDPQPLFELTAEDAAPDSSVSLHTSGTGYEWSGVGFGLRWSALDSEGNWVECMYDASVYEGIHFWAKGSGVDIRLTIAVPESLPPDSGGSCANDCWDHPGIDFEPTSDWREYYVPFSAMLPRSLVGGLDPSRLRTVQWEFAPDTAYELWLDDVGFYRPGEATE